MVQSAHLLSSEKTNKTEVSIYFLFNLFCFFSNNNQKMESIFKKLGEKKDLKEELRRWCRKNGIKISFTVNMTFTKSKSIYRKLQITYKKGFGKAKARWLENELKLFHFALLGVSILTQTKIVDFNKQNWQILQEAFPNKPQSILEYEAKNFIITKNELKKKWQQQEDKLLTDIVRTKLDQIKWNEIAIELYLSSNNLFFRNGKLCRQRWLNHLDSAINHEKWSYEQDLTLMKGVLQNGKKWSKIMLHFNNQRTQHMIKNRYLSLILKCRKKYPFIQDQESAQVKVFQEMGLQTDDFRLQQENIYSQKRLRVRNCAHQQQVSQKKSQIKASLEQAKSEQQSAKEDAGDSQQAALEEDYIKQGNIISNSVQYLKLNSIATMQTPSPTAFITPIPFINCISFYPNLQYFHVYMNNFSNIVGSYQNLSPQ